MKKNEVFSQVAEIEEKIGGLYKELGILKQKIITLLEENHHLQLENEQLRERLKIEDQGNNKDNQQKNEQASIGEGHDNLARLYQEGFHVCNVHYGGLRTEGDCLFCLTFLNKK